jgi:hypothetical protein
MQQQPPALSSTLLTSVLRVTWGGKITISIHVYHRLKTFCCRKRTLSYLYSLLYEILGLNAQDWPLKTETHVCIMKGRTAHHPATAVVKITTNERPGAIGAMFRSLERPLSLCVPEVLPKKAHCINDTEKWRIQNGDPWIQIESFRFGSFWSGILFMGCNVLEFTRVHDTYMYMWTWIHYIYTALLTLYYIYIYIRIIYTCELGYITYTQDC